MGIYTFFLGSSSHSCCNVQTNDRAGIIKVSLSDKGNSMDVGLSQGSDTTSEIVCEHTITDIKTLFEEIVATIISNELNNFTPANPINEEELMEQLIQEIEYDDRFRDDNDSDNLSGYSDIISISSNSTFTISDVKKNYEDILRNIAIANDFLNSA